MEIPDSSPTAVIRGLAEYFTSTAMSLTSHSLTWLIQLGSNWEIPACTLGA